jgi:hypothetical protein
MQRFKTITDLNLQTFPQHRVLNKVSSSDFKGVLEKAQALGVVIKKAIIIEFKKDTKEWLLSDPKDKLVFPARSRIFPICQAGENRSQIANILLDKQKAAHPSCEWIIYPPHGAEGSVDPFIKPTMSPDQLNVAGDRVDWDREMAYQYHKVSPEPMFEAELKSPRQPRMHESKLLLEVGKGMVKGKKDPVPSPQTVIAMLQERDQQALTLARDYMTENFFYHDLIKNRGSSTQLLCFNRSLHVTLYRLVETAELKGLKHGALNGIVVQCIDTMDPIVMKSLPNFIKLMEGLIQGPTVEDKERKVLAPSVNTVTPASTSTVQAQSISTVPVPHSSTALNNQMKYENLPNEFVTYFNTTVPLPARSVVPDCNHKMLWNNMLFPKQRQEIIEKFLKPQVPIAMTQLPSVDTAETKAILSSPVAASVLPVAVATPFLPQSPTVPQMTPHHFFSEPGGRIQHPMPSADDNKAEEKVRLHLMLIHHLKEKLPMNYRIYAITNMLEDVMWYACCAETQWPHRALNLQYFVYHTINNFDFTSPDAHTQFYPMLQNMLNFHVDVYYYLKDAPAVFESPYKDEIFNLVGEIDKRVSNEEAMGINNTYIVTEMVAIIKSYTPYPEGMLVGLKHFLNHLEEQENARYMVSSVRPRC